MNTTQRSQIRSSITSLFSTFAVFSTSSLSATLSRLACATALSFSMPARAQEVTRMPETTQQSVGLDLGLENAFIARATYAHRLDLGVLSDARLHARATLPFASPDLGDWGIDGGLRATPLEWHDLRLTVVADLSLRRSSNVLFSATALGLGGTVLLGYEGPSWGLSAEGGYAQVLATHLSHSDLYRETFYGDAQDGWYAVTGGTTHAGLRGGVRFGAIEIAARAGMNRTGAFRPITPPFYFTLGGTYAF